MHGYLGTTPARLAPGDVRVTRNGLLGALVGRLDFARWQHTGCMSPGLIKLCGDDNGTGSQVLGQNGRRLLEEARRR